MKLRAMAAALALAGMAGMALAKPKGKSDQAIKTDEGAALVAAMEKFATPGEGHKRLQSTVGTWSVKVKSWVGTGEPIESTGTSVVRPILDGRYFEEDYTATMMGHPFSGHGITGYDNGRKRYVGAWVDSMGTGIMVSDGAADESGKTIISEATETNPMTGQPHQVRIVDHLESEGRRVLQFYDKGADGKESRVMEIVYARR